MSLSKLIVSCHHFLLRYSTFLWYLFVFISLSDLCMCVVNENKQDAKLFDIASDRLEKGKQLLTSGHYVDALSYFRSAIDADSQNYLAYFHRATTYLAMGGSKSALSDLTRVISLKPGFIAARLQRGNVFLKQGNFAEAKSDFQYVMESDSLSNEAYYQLGLTIQMRQQVKQAEDLLFKHKNYTKAIEILTNIIEHCPWSSKIRRLRANSYVQTGDTTKAIDDLKIAAKLIPDNVETFFQMSLIYYSIGNAPDSLTNIRQCLKLDPDHTACRAHYTKVRAIVKQLGAVQDATSQSNWLSCRDAARQILQLLSVDPLSSAFVYRAHSSLCVCMSRGRCPALETISTCTELLNTYNVSDADIFLSRADAYVRNEDYKLALDDLERAYQVKHSSHIENRIKRVRKLMRRSKKRDYYKILGVRRTANKAEILRSYRNLAVKWHPDKYEGHDKKKAEKTFINIVAAKEILIDPEKRARFDAGDDPLAVEQRIQYSRFFHNYFQSFNNGNGQGFHFRFRFHR